MKLSLSEMFVLAIGLRWVLCRYRYTEFIRTGLTKFFSLDFFPKAQLNGIEQNIFQYVWESLIDCPVCSGCWAGYVVFGLYGIKWGDFDLLNIALFWVFSLTCGYLSLIIESVSYPFLLAYENGMSNGSDEYENEPEYEADNDAEEERQVLSDLEIGLSRLSLDNN